MSKIRSKDTGPEILLRRALWEKGLRYRVHSEKYPGTPDILFAKHRTVVFIDGEFWHGFNWSEKRNRIKANREYWIKKIERNIERDRETNSTYTSKGWAVVRFWEREIRTNLEGCVELVIATTTKRPVKKFAKSKLSKIPILYPDQSEEFSFET